MAKQIATWAAFAVLMASAATSVMAQAATVKGIQYPETVETAGEPLKLIGAGLREKWFFDVYSMGAYSLSGDCEAAAIISADEIKSLRLDMLRDVTADRIAAALREALADNTPRDASAPLRGRINAFLSSFQVNLPKGARMELTYIPEIGVLLTLNGRQQGPPTAGKDFADILWSAYFGSKSCCSALKKQILSNCLKRSRSQSRVGEADAEKNAGWRQLLSTTRRPAGQNRDFRERALHLSAHRSQVLSTASLI